MKGKTRCGLLTLAVWALCAAAAAQTVTGTLQGTVRDTGGGVLPGATVTVRQVETGTERVLVTNGEGFYSAPFLQILGQATWYSPRVVQLVLRYRY